MGGTEVSRLDSCFVFLIYSLVPFRAGFFFLKGAFLLAQYIYKYIFFIEFRIYIIFKVFYLIFNINYYDMGPGANPINIYL